MESEQDNAEIKNESKNVHEGHRRRVREGITKNGWDNLNEHQMLEYILFNVVPRQDTNELSHRLLSEFGSLAGVLDADIEDLRSIKGIGERTAIYLNSYQNIFKVYKQSKTSLKPRVTCVKEVYDCLGESLSLLANEECYLLCLNSSSRLILAKKLGAGTNNQVAVSMKDITETIIRTNTCALILVHNHPSGSLEPSQEDIDLTKKVFLNLVLNDTYMLDHIIVSPKGYYSFKHNGFIDGFEREYNDLIRRASFKCKKPFYE